MMPILESEMRTLCKDNSLWWNLLDVSSFPCLMSFTSFFQPPRLYVISKWPQPRYTRLLITPTGY